MKTIVEWIRVSEAENIISVDDADSLRAAIERARVVGVLDAYARTHWVGSFRTEPEDVDGEQVWLCHNDDKGFRGSTPDAARATAAKAIESGEV